MRIFLLIVGLALILFVGSMSFFTVGPTEYVYVTQFGRPVAIHDGADQEQGAGFHWRWPWPVQSIRRFDRRLQYFDLPTIELTTKDPKNESTGNILIFEAYACWRIADLAPDYSGDLRDHPVNLFYTGLVAEGPEDYLAKQINSQLDGAIVRMTMDDLVNTDGQHVEMKMNQLWSGLLSDLRPRLRTRGIELVDVRLRRFYHSDQVRTSIFERIKSERNRKAEEYRTEGEEKASKIRSEADATARITLAEAKKYEEIKKGEADRMAAKLRNEAHGQDPEFYIFLKKLENLQSILGDNKSILLLSSHRAIFDMLFQPPQSGVPVQGSQPTIPSPGVSFPQNQNPLESKKSQENKKKNGGQK